MKSVKIVLKSKKYLAYCRLCYIFAPVNMFHSNFKQMIYIEFLDPEFSKMRALMNRNFRVKFDGVLCGFSRLCFYLGNARAFELVRRALVSTLYKFSPKALTCGHSVIFYSK